MKKVKNPKVGQLVEVPTYCFAPMRHGWNGWLFNIGVIEDIYTGKTGKRCATVRYNNHGSESTKGFVLDNVFQYEFLDMQQKFVDENKDAKSFGHEIEFMIRNGFIHR